MPLLPPAQLVEHPADLMIDVFGTFLGKRSERMVVRWRNNDPPFRRSVMINREQAPTVAASNTNAENSASSIGTDQPALTIHPADDAITQLRDLWATEPLTEPPPRPAPSTRLQTQLQDITGVAVPSVTEWCEQVVPLSRLRSVTVSGRGVTVSSDLIEALVERGIAFSFLSRRGQPVAQLSAPGLGGTVQTRRSQLAAYTTPLGVQLAVEFIRGKLRNQKHQLQYSGKYLKAADPERFAQLEKKVAALANLRKQLQGFEAADLDRVRDKLMGYEGTGARIYWEGVKILLDGRVEFPGRETRGAIDPVNSALNYGYGILYGQVSAAVVNAGLELYAGFLHVDRPGKPALVLDLVEEFRAPVVDRAVLAIVNQGSPLETDAHGLTTATRKLVADRVLERLSTPVPYEGKRWSLGNIIQNQARHLAVAVRGERVYRSFASRW
ncbi:CRISPR-associated endonuclease Cas1 [bacterium]|nr:CRISPR-associated endonuclease Cas1 [bacterium]